MKNMTYLTNEGENVKLTRRTDIGKSLVLAKAYLINHDLITFSDVLKEKKRLIDILNGSQKEYTDRSEDIYLLSVDLYYYYKIKNYQKKLAKIDTIISAYEFVCGASVEELLDSDPEQVRTTAYHMTAIGEFYIPEDIFHKPIDLSVMGLSARFIDSYSTYMFNQENNTALTVEEYLSLEKEAIKNIRKNRRK